jgi:hypothetical protein
MSTAYVSPFPPSPAGSPAAVPWTPSAELLELTGMLTRANLSAVEDRTSGLRRLQELTADGAGTPIDQVRTCGTIKSLPFLRISKKMRLNLLHAEFVAAGREFNRALLAAKIAAGDRLDAIAIDNAVPHEVQRLAAAVSVRASTNMKVEWAELTDREIPEHLMPPPMQELPIASTPAPVAAVAGRAVSAQERVQARAAFAHVFGAERTNALVGTEDNDLSGPILDAAVRAGLLEKDLPAPTHAHAGGMFKAQGTHGGKRGNGFKKRKRVSR